ncbi:hypothetical protein [Phenylobacterium sp.]|uniref:hypothetical protein n=1 Tax=Phenylobacterium sp. TaxID=1871053 RepID=UPI0012090F72|nr:hypothetical protein [Phenylobacterium sp.]THD59729.1 MAG: hypothetical protein E8A49_15565 [Phenylobacterium sp.]
MRRVLPLLAVALALGLAACEQTGNNVSGTADYDSLKRAQEACTAQGGKLVLKDGGDAQYMQDYTCKGT